MAGKTVLSIIVDQLVAGGLNEFVFVVGYLGEKIQDYVKANYPEITAHFIFQTDRQGIGHAIRLAREGFAVSSGSACTADTLRPSHVLAAMGVLTHGNVRLSLHRSSTMADVDRFLAVLPGVVARLRAEAGVAGL